MLGSLRLSRQGLIVTLAILFVACGRQNQADRSANNVPITQLERTYGRLIAVANAPTPDQHGTGDRVGLFQDENGTIWGIPLIMGESQTVLACAPAQLRELPVTDTLPADISELLGAANEPSGWRGGTGRLELWYRDSQGVVHWHPVSSAELKPPSLCMTQSPPTMPSRFYRLAKASNK